MEAPTPVSALLHAATLVKKLPFNSVNYYIINSLYAGKASNQVYIYRYLKDIREIYKKILMLKNKLKLLRCSWNLTFVNKNFLEVDQQVTLVSVHFPAIPPI